MSLLFGARLVSILTLGLAIIDLLMRIIMPFENVNRIPSKDVIYLVHELPIYLLITSLQLSSYVLRFIVASVAMVKRLVVVIAHGAVWTLNIPQILNIIIGGAIHSEDCRFVDWAI